MHICSKSINNTLSKKQKNLADSPAAENNLTKHVGSLFAENRLKVFGKGTRSVSYLIAPNPLTGPPMSRGESALAGVSDNPRITTSGVVRVLVSFELE